MKSLIIVFSRKRFHWIFAIVLGGMFGLTTGQSASAQSDSSPLEAARAAAEKARQEQTAAEKAVAAAQAKEEKQAADKILAEKTAAARKANEVLRAQETFAADKAVVSTKAALSKAEKAGGEAAAAARKATAKADTARTARDRANTEKAAAQKAAKEASGDKKASADKALAEKNVASQNAEKQFQAARAAAEKAAADKKDREQKVSSASKAVAQATEQAAVAKAAAIGGLKPLAASAWNYEKARHLLFRAGFGGPPEEVTRLHEMGLVAAVDYLVDYHLQPDDVGWFDAFPHQRTAPYEQHLNAAQKAELNQSRVSFRQNQHHRMRRAWLQRMAETKRPLQEKLALFWHGHFACSFLAGEDSYAMWKQNELFRHRASGNFGALLNGIAHDPAMIRYLDNHENFKGSGNENLGREILELFSMGEGQGYTEKDLAEAARALTGYNFEYHNGQFKFVASRHDTGEKTLFGKKGNFGGDELVGLILQQPSTSRYISGKLFRFFAHSHPDKETVEKMSHVLRSHQYEMKPMLRNLFRSEEFYSERSMGNHIKSPVELMVGVIRTLKLEKVDYASIDGTTSNLGQRLFEPPNVAGWEGGKAWVDASSLLQRYNVVAKLVEPTDLVAWLEKSKTSDPAAAVDSLARAVLCVPLSKAKRQELITYLGTLPPPEQWAGKRKEINARLQAVLVALVSLPEYQLAGATPICDPPKFELAVATRR
jgi:hypothetical protein